MKAIRLKHLIFIVIMPLFSNSWAELTPLSDQLLHQVNGQGSSFISYTLDNYSVTSEDFDLELNFDADIPIHFSKFSLVGASSVGYFNNTQGVSLGNHNDPFTLSLQDESFTDANNATTTATSLVAAFPRGYYVDELPDDIDSKFNLTTRASLTHQSGNELHTWLSLKGISLDDSYLKIWADPNNGLSMSGKVKLYVDQVVTDINPLVTPKPGNDVSKQLQVDKLDVSLPLGNTLYQPITIDIDENLNFITKLKAIDLASAPTFYDSAVKGNLSVDNITMNGYESGAIEIEGIQLHYLRIETHDLF